MNKQIRLATGDKVKIIDRGSPHFGKTGILREIQSQSTREINLSSKVINSKEEFCFIVKLEGAESAVKFTSSQVGKI